MDLRTGKQMPEFLAGGVYGAFFVKCEVAAVAKHPCTVNNDVADDFRRGRIHEC